MVTTMRKTVPDIQSRKTLGSEPIVCLTAYTAPMAALLDPHCDVLLVGDSVAMVIYGHPTTLQADMDMMIRHGQAVMRSTEKSLVVIDMPFGSYQESKEVAFRNAAIILKETGAAAVKIEGGSEMAETVQYLSQRGIPVMGHIGLRPQAVNTLGGFKTQGRDDVSSREIIEDAKAIAAAGAFATVLEAVPESLAMEVTKASSCPIIGIGASNVCDGQILVCDDMLGLCNGKKPKFVKEYAHLAEAITTAARQYASEVKSRSFPGEENIYSAKPVPAPIQPEPVIEQTLMAEESTATPITLRAIPRTYRD